MNATNNGISLGVSEAWLEADAASVANDSDFQAYVEQTAANSGTSPDTVIQQISSLDLMAVSTATEPGEAANVMVMAGPVPASDLPSEDTVQYLVEGSNGTPKEFSVVETALGESIVQSYTSSASGTLMEGVFLIVPSGTGSGFSVIGINTTDAAQTQELTDNIMKSVQKTQ